MGIVVNGMLTGSMPGPAPEHPLLVAATLRSFILGVVVLGGGLWALAPALRGRWLKGIALCFITIAMGLAAANLVILGSFAGLTSTSGALGGLGTFITSIATLLLSIAAARTPGFSRIGAALMLWVGLTTIPLLVGTPLPVGPGWATDFLAFFTSGAAFVGLGALVWSPAAARRPAEPATASA